MDFIIILWLMKRCRASAASRVWAQASTRDGDRADVTWKNLHSPHDGLLVQGKKLKKKSLLQP
jgi:hypothetical protein